MSNTRNIKINKTITITSQDYFNIEKVFYNYLQHNPRTPEVIKTMQSIIDQAID